MMPDLITSPYANMRAAITSVLSAQEKIRSEISNHAERHSRKLDEMRKDAENTARIHEGIARQAG